MPWWVSPSPAPARPVDGKQHIGVLQVDVVDELVVAALEESGIKRYQRAHPLHRQPRRKGDGVLFRHAHVKKVIPVLF